MAESAAKSARHAPEVRRTMSANAPSYYMPLAGASSQDLNSSIPAPRRHLGEKILPRVQALQPVRHGFYIDSVYMVLYRYSLRFCVQVSCRTSVSKLSHEMVHCVLCYNVHKLIYDLNF